MGVLPFPSDRYMRLLAEAIYSVAYLEWAILGDLDRLASVELSVWTGLSRMTTGQLAGILQAASAHASDPHERTWLAAAAEALADVVELRNQVVHARPATIDGQQMLYRWATANGSREHEVHAIDDAALTRLRDRCAHHVGRLSAVRLPSG